MVPGLQNNITLKYLNIIGNDGDPATGTALVEASLMTNFSPVDIDIDHNPPRTRQEILSTDTKTIIALDEEDEDMDAEMQQISPPPPGSVPGTTRSRTSSS